MAFSGLRIASSTRALLRPPQTSFLRNGRNFQTTAARLDTATASIPTVRKPVGAFRGSVFGFLLGAVTSGSALYYYVIDDYKVSNELLTEDIYSLSAATSRIESYVHGLEAEMAALRKRVN